MDDHRGSITVAALMGTGAATLGLALFGLVGVGGDLRAADAANRSTTPALTTQELSDALREEQRSPKWDGSGDCTPPTSPEAASSATPSPVPTPADPASQKEI